MARNSLVSGRNGSDWDEALMTEGDWYRRGHEQAMAMSNGLDWTYSSADRDGDPTGGDLDGDWSDLHHANSRDRIGDEYFDAEIDLDTWRAAGLEPPNIT